jgi:hypothetical protein
MLFTEQILQTIRAVMPDNANIQVVPGIGVLNVGVSWPLYDDPNRPNKRSKMIAIRVSQEAAEDFANASDPEAAYRRVSAFLSARLAQFDPRHNAPNYEQPPVEEWVIGLAVLFGESSS